MKNGFNRREFLQTVSGTIAALALGGDSEVPRVLKEQKRKVTGALNPKKRENDAPRKSESAVQYTERLLGEFEDLKKRTFPPAIPEWERTGDRMLMIMTFKTPDAAEKLIAQYKSFIKGIPQETTLHVVTTSESDQFIRDEIKSLSPDIKLMTHPLPIKEGRNGVIYAQDIVFSTGMTDWNGAAHVLASTAERLVVFPGDTVTPEDMRWHAIQFDLDNKLGKFFPETFKVIKVPVNCEGGDIEISRLPNGRSVLFLGTYGIVDQAIFMAVGMMKMNGSYAEGLFKAVLDKITAAYKKVTGVDEVIVIDEEKLVTWGEGVLQRKVKGPYDRSTFFHIDMVFKTCVAADGTPIAFFTEPTKDAQMVTARHAAYLDRIKKQLADLGYKIIELPCGSYPARNYINMLMFNRQSEPTVMLPQYGEPTDAGARRIVEEQGFHVIPVDISQFFNSREDQENIGSVHCLVEVLR